MTEQELANSLFGREGSSSTSQSLLSGIAVSASVDGKCLVQIDGARIGASDETSVLLETTCAVAIGDKCVISLFGPDGGGKKAFVSGVIGGGEGGGGDTSELEQRVSTLEDRLNTDETKINEVISTINDFKWRRLYLWTLSGSSRASLWYRRSTGDVLVSVNVQGSMNSGWNWFNSAALPTDLRPGAFPTAALYDARNVIWADPQILIASGSDGHVSAYIQNSGTSSEGGTISYLVQPGLNYSSTTWIGPDIDSQLSLTRALAARIALGDGLAEQQDLEKDEAALNEAYDIIFGDDE